ncbi:MAG TPA: hypothetical protein VF979_12735 [Streptosporangiaceae bacterium]
MFVEACQFAEALGGRRDLGLTRQQAQAIFDRDRDSAGGIVDPVGRPARPSGGLTAE